MKKIPFRIIFIILIICTTISILAYFTPTLLGTLVFITLGSIALGYYYFQPFSEFGLLRRSHPVAKTEIDKVEKVLAQNRADLNAREKVISEELNSLVRRFQAGRDKLVEIEKIRAETKFNEQEDLSSGFKKITDNTIENLVKAFLELSASDAKLYFDQIGTQTDKVQNNSRIEPQRDKVQDDVHIGSS